MKTTHRIVHGDSRQLNLLSDHSVHLVITSPPYWQLKDYGTEQQLGFYDTYEGYINNLNLVWKECHRVLHPGCRLCINIGDQFARAVYYGRYKVIPIRTEIIKFCETIGFDYMGAIIWQKVTTTNTTGGATIMGSFPYPRNGILKIDYEFILIFKKLGEAPKPSSESKKLSTLTREEWNAYFSGHWNFSGVRQNGHLAMFPEELPARLIKMFSFYGETVLDPFLGSGTTSVAAKNLGRNSIGYEINQSFFDIIRQRLNVNQMDLVGSQYFILEDAIKNDYNEEIEKLPYIFKDPLKLNNKIDPRKLKFGSKINGSAEEAFEYLVVREILSTNLVKLSNNLTVRLIGIKENEQAKGKAIDYLQKKVKGQKIYLKYDINKYDGNNNLFCYIFLKNKTFINAQLIKLGYADVDDDQIFKYKEKFITLGANHG